MPSKTKKPTHPKKKKHIPRKPLGIPEEWPEELKEAEIAFFHAFLEWACADFKPGETAQIIPFPTRPRDD